MFNVGLTGGIGSGKSTVAMLFKELGVTIIDADAIAHHITKPNTYILETIVEHFGKNILNADETLNRSALRGIIFNDPDERQWLENHLHPVIREAMKSKITTADSMYSILVIPLLAESKLKHFDYLNRICVIDVPEKVQIQRTMKRDNISKVDIKAILASQVTNEERLNIADDVIRNDSSLNYLKKQVIKLNQKYLTLARK